MMLYFDDYKNVGSLTNLPLWVDGYRVSIVLPRVDVFPATTRTLGCHRPTWLGDAAFNTRKYGFLVLPCNSGGLCYALMRVDDSYQCELRARHFR